MREYDVNNLNEQEFEAMLQDSVAELPPADIAYEVTPWRKAINRILTGFALGAITLNFVGLNYLLPTIGMFLLLLGFRTLHNENRWFRGCWILTLIRIAYYLPTLVLNTTIYQSAFYASDFVDILTVANVAIQMLQYICLWRALCAVKEKAGLEPRAGSAVALILWNVLICIWGLISIPANLFIAVILLTAYICIIRSLVKLSKELDEAGYCISGAPVRFTDRAIVLALTLALLIGCACGYIFFNRYPMEWSPVSQNEAEEVQQVKEHLLSLGFPEHILADLTEEDILACKDARRVVVQKALFPVNEGRQVTERQADGILHIYTVYDQEELQITGVGVELAGQREQWKLFHHFQWVIDPGFYGTEAIQLWPAYRNGKGWMSSGEITGRVLYNDGDQVYAASYFSLGNETYTSNSIFWGEQTSTDIFAEFSMPRGGENHRGYVSYTIKEAQDGWIVDAWINYTHQMTWLQYPTITAKQKNMTSGSWDTMVFNTVQDALQFYPTEEVRPLDGSDE